MRWRQVLVLYAIAAVLAAVYFRPLPATTGPVDPDGKPARRHVFALDRAQLSEISIEHGGRRIVARRDDDGWAIAEPAGAPIPSSLVDAFAAALVEAEEIEHLDGDADLVAFGLDDGTATRVEIRPAGGPPDTLWLGASNPSGTAVYARRLGTPGVLLVGRTLQYYAELVMQALPAPTVPAGTGADPVGRTRPLTAPRRAV
jgi:hypothetical protein